MKDRLYWFFQFTVCYKFNKAKEKLFIKFAWLLPRYLVMWCYVRVVAHATTGDYGSTIVLDLTAVDALKRWQKI